MVDIKERLEQEKIKLENFKHNLKNFNDTFYIKDKYYIELERTGRDFYYEISQNLFSIPLLFSSLFYPNATTCFFVELFNFYQDLPKHANLPYYVYSQSLTTYFLKTLGRNDIVELLSCNKSHIFELNDYMMMLGNFHNKETWMYCCYFYKRRSFNKNDILLVKNMANFLNIDFSQLKIVFEENKMFLKMKSKYKCQQFVTGNVFKNIYKQRKVLYYVLKEYKDYFFDDEKENSKQLSK